MDERYTVRRRCRERDVEFGRVAVRLQWATHDKQIRCGASQATRIILGWLKYETLRQNKREVHLTTASYYCLVMQDSFFFSTY